MDYQDWQQQPGSNHFWHAARRQLISHLLHLTGQHHEQILEIGCGTGENLPLLQKLGPTLGLDSNPEALALVDPAYQTELADITKQPLPANRYDLIACFDVLEHLPNDQAVLYNLNQALKPGGYLVFTVPAYAWLFSSHDRALQHYRRYSRQQLQQRLQQANFTIAHLSYWNSCLLPAIIPWRLFKKISHAPARSDTQAIHPWLNALLYRLLLAETKLVQKGWRWPWGLSLVGLARKPQATTAHNSEHYEN